MVFMGFLAGPKWSIWAVKKGLGYDSGMFFLFFFGEEIMSLPPGYRDYEIAHETSHETGIPFVNQPGFHGVSTPKDPKGGLVQEPSPNNLVFKALYIFEDWWTIIPLHINSPRWMSIPPPNIGCPKSVVETFKFLGQRNAMNGTTSLPDSHHARLRNLTFLWSKAAVVAWEKVTLDWIQKEYERTTSKCIHILYMSKSNFRNSSLNLISTSYPFTRKTSGCCSQAESIQTFKDPIPSGLKLGVSSPSWRLSWSKFEMSRIFGSFIRGVWSHCVTASVLLQKQFSWMVGPKS